MRRLVAICLSVLIASSIVATPAIAGGEGLAQRAATELVGTVLIFPDDSALFDETPTLSAYLWSSGPFTVPISNRLILFFVNGVFIGAGFTGGQEPKATVTPPALPPGTYRTTAIFPGDALFASAATDAQLVIKPRETQLIMFGAEGTFGGTVTLEAKLAFLVLVQEPPPCYPSPPPNPRICATWVPFPFTGQTVYFFRLGTFVGSAITDADGIARLTVPLTGIDAGEYDGNAAWYPGLSTFTGATAGGFMRVLPQQTSLLVAPAVGPSGESTSFVAQLSAREAALTGRQVVFSRNDVVVGKARTDSNGVARIEHVSLRDVAPGAYPEGVKALFLGERNYRGSVAAAPLVVTTH